MDPQSFHRLMKLLLDTGESASLQDASEAFSEYGIRVQIGAAVRDSEADQIIAMTVINAASRSFLGNVVIDCDDFRLQVPGFEDVWLSAFAEWAGVQPSSKVLPNWPTIAVGTRDVAGAISPWADGWLFGTGASGSGRCFAPACVAAGGLAVSEAFSILRGDNPYAGRREVAISLWGYGKDGIGPEVSTMPCSCWIIGLGHLGQAYAWTIGFLRANGSRIVLQDIDVVTDSTLSTSMISRASDVGEKKTRVVSLWLEGRGFKTSLVERRFDEAQRLTADEPRTALIGVDNAAARRVIESTGFQCAIDAGLGSGYADFRAIRMRVFPGPSRAADLWANSEPARPNLAPPAYQALLQGGADPCGVTTLATRSVGAPFVGCVAAGFVVAELMRRSTGGRAIGLVDINLREPRRMQWEWVS